MASVGFSGRSAKQFPSRPPVKVLIVAAHDSLGGAARAIHRVFSALEEHRSGEFKVTLRTITKTRNSSSIIGGKPRRSLRENALYFLRTRLPRALKPAPFSSTNTLLHSPALHHTGLAREINAMKPDVVLLGWLGNFTLSIEEVSRIKAPVIFRMSDMWVFSGAEHYTSSGRYREGYSRVSRPSGESGQDLNRSTFLRKKKHWMKRYQLIALTSWLAKEARSSTLTRDWPIEVIPVPIDVDHWSPSDSHASRKLLGLPIDSPVVMFGAGAGMELSHKGGDLLVEAIPILAKMMLESGIHRKGPTLAVFGQAEGVKFIGDVPVHYLGRLDDEQLKMAYSACDVFVAPSRLEAFGQVAAEAQSCGAPVVAFDNSGLSDVVEDFHTGRLAKAFSPEDLASCIYWVLEDDTRRRELSSRARERALERWHPQVVSASYGRVLRKAAQGE